MTTALSSEKARATDLEAELHQTTRDRDSRIGKLQEALRESADANGEVGATLERYEGDLKALQDRFDRTSAELRSLTQSHNRLIGENDAAQSSLKEKESMGACEGL